MVTYPKDWIAYIFDEMFQIYSNNTLSRDKLAEQGAIGNIHYGDVLIKYGAVLSDKDSVPKIKKEYESVAKVFLQRNDVIVADTAEDETVGKVVQIGNMSFPLVGGLHTIVCRPLIPTATGYLGYYMNSKGYHDQLLPYITGIKVSSVSKTSIRKTELYLPPTVDEQTAIVEVIRQFDVHIENLTKLIIKKKSIREGVLEELVTGKTRIQGFSEKWVKYQISEITQTIITGGTPSTTRKEYYGGNIPWLSSTEIHQKLITTPTTYITDLGLQYSSAKIAPESSVLIALAGQGKTRGTAAYLTRAMALNQSLAALVANDKCNSEFLYYLIDNMYYPLREISSGDGGRGGLNKKLLANIIVTIPKDIAEQEAIATVLQTMDNEIHSLEIERDKIQQIREGVMDDLLTGNVRLTD